MLTLKDWIPCVRWLLKQGGDQVGVEMLSNFTIYPPDLDRLSDEYVTFHLNTSLDSLEYSKPYLDGRSSAEDVVRNIRKYMSRHDSKSMFIMSVITDNGKYLPTLADFVIENGLTWEIQANKFYEPDFDSNEVNSNMEQVLDKCFVADYPVDHLLFNFCDLSTERMCSNGTTMFRVMADGSVTNCQMQNEIIGTVFDDILTVLNQNQTCQINRRSECFDCPIFMYCHGDCPMKSRDERRIEYICEIMRFYVLKALSVQLKQREKSYAKSLPS